MNISMTVLTDGRKHYIEKALPTWIDAYGDQITSKAIIDDSGDADYRLWLRDTFPDFYIVPVGYERQGHAPAMREVFNSVLNFGKGYNLHIEDDFVLHNPPDLSEVVSILDNFKELSQISFMRQPWYPNEIEHGGVVQAIEADSPNAGFYTRYHDGIPWTIHKAFWTCNPSVFPYWVAQRKWPNPPWSEAQFSQSLMRDKVSGIWGTRDNWIVTEHIGKERNGTTY